MLVCFYDRRNLKGKKGKKIWGFMVKIFIIFGVGFMD